MKTELDKEIEILEKEIKILSRRRRTEEGSKSRRTLSTIDMKFGKIGGLIQGAELTSKAKDKEFLEIVDNWEEENIKSLWKTIPKNVIFKQLTPEDIAKAQEVLFRGLANLLKEKLKQKLEEK